MNKQAIINTDNKIVIMRSLKNNHDNNSNNSNNSNNNSSNNVSKNFLGFVNMVSI